MRGNVGLGCVLRFLALVVAGILALGGSGSALAASETGFGYQGWGVRGGVSVDPDQFFFGADVDMGDVIPSLGFVPSVTIGFGDHVTLVAINPDLAYFFPVQDVGSLYVGGLLSFEWMKFDRGLPDVPGYTNADDTETELGVHVMGGLRLTSTPIFFEIGVGLEDEPDFRGAVGYRF